MGLKEEIMNIRARIITFMLVLLMIITLNINHVSSTSYEWIPLNDDLPTPEVSDLAIDPHNNQIIYALTRDAGIYRTTDGGSNWEQVNNGLEGYDVSSIYIHPKNPQVIYAGSYGIFKSENTGNSWAQLDLMLSSKVNCIEVDPSHSNIIYIGTEEEGVFKSADSGATWLSASQGLRESDYFSFPSIKTLFLDTSNSMVIYAGTDKGVYKSINEGKSWTEINNGLKQIIKVKKEIKPGVFTEVDLEITPVVFSEAVNSSNPLNIYLGTDSGLFVTENGGEKWSKVSALEELCITKIILSEKLEKIIVGTDKGLFISYDSFKTSKKLGQGKLDGQINGLVVSFNETINIYAGTNDGIFKSLDGGNDFSQSNKGLVNIDISEIASGKDNNLLFISAGENGLFKSVDFGEAWINLRNSQDFLSANTVAIDTYNDQSIFLGTDQGIYISKDGGSTFDPSFKRLEGKETYSIVCINSKIILAGTAKGLYKSEDSGLTWRLSNLGMTEGEDIAVISLASGTKNSEVVYAGTIDKGIYKSEDAGDSWITVNQGFDVPMPPVNVIKIDPANTSIAYAGTEGNGLWKTENGGSEWMKIDDVPSPWVKNIAISSMDSKNIFAVFYPEGIFESKDSGITWSDIKFNLPSKEITATLFAGNSLLIGAKSGVYKLRVTYAIAASSSLGGLISPSGAISAKTGDTKTFVITPNSGYKISNVRIDGKSIGSVSSYTFSNISSDHTIGVAFEKEVKQTEIILKIGNSTFTVNGMMQTLDSPPIIKNNRTLLPIRAVVEALGGTVGWDAMERRVTVSLGTTTIELWIGKSIAKVNGVDTPIDSANPKVVPEIINSRTMLPLRFVTENLGCDVQWDGTTKMITIKYKY